MNTIMILMFLLTPCITAATDDTCPDDMQLFKRPDGTLDCLYCRECPAGTLKTKNCSLEHDTECTKCYRSVHYNDVGNTCNPCGVCEPGSFLQKNCTQFDDTVCTPCLNGTFSKTQNEDRCTDCGNCSEGIITECTNAKDVVCKKKDVSPKPEVVVVIVIVAGILIVITGSIVAVVMIRHRMKEKKQLEDIEDISDERVPLNEVQTRNSDTDVISTKDKARFNDFKTNVGFLVVNGDRQQGPGSQVQTRPILVLRIGKDFGMTALQALKRRINPGQSKHKIDYTKLQADNVYIEFHAHENVIKYRISSNTPVFEDVDLDIVILKIKQDDTEASSIHDTHVFKLTTSDCFQESHLQISDFKAKPSNGKGRDFNEKTVSLPVGFDRAINILEFVFETNMLRYIQDKNKRDFDISINELGRNIFIKDSKQLKKVEDLRKNEQLNDIINNPTGPEDVTTVFVSGQYSSGCPVYTYDDTGNLQVYCILTHRVPKILDVLNESDQKICFGTIQNVTAGTKITGIYKALKKANQNSLIKAVFESEVKS